MRSASRLRARTPCQPAARFPRASELSSTFPSDAAENGKVFFSAILQTNRLTAWQTARGAGYCHGVQEACSAQCGRPARGGHAAHREDGGGHREVLAAANCSESITLTECFAQHAQLLGKDLRSPIRSAFVPSRHTCNTFRHYSRK